LERPAARKRSGASVWTAGSYDPALNLVFFGTAQTYDTGPLVHPSKEPGVTNDGLYTDTTLAFDPDTGKLVWHFQHVQNDQWDLDWAFERQLINLRSTADKRIVVTPARKRSTTPWMRPPANMSFPWISASKT
jgi:alcohol dehydrogenase (cytochrome c)